MVWKFIYRMPEFFSIWVTFCRENIFILYPYIYLCMNRYILSPCDSELFDLLDNWLTLPWTISWSHSQDSHDYNTLTNVRKRTLAKPARNNLTTQSVTNLATQPEKQPGDTARKTTWRHSQKNNLATQPEKQPLPDLAGWQHTIGWRPPSPGIGDRMAPLHKLTSLRTRS